MDAVWVFVTVLALAISVFAFSAVVGTKVERWRDDAGIDPPGRSRRVSTARSAAGLACTIFGSAVGAGFVILGGWWIAVGAVLIVTLGAVFMLALGEWIGAAVFAALGVLCWILLLTVKPKTEPRRGPCLRAE
jgi:hypothetical protein